MHMHTQCAYTAILKLIHTFTHIKLCPTMSYIASYHGHNFQNYPSSWATVSTVWHSDCRAWWHHMAHLPRCFITGSWWSWGNSQGTRLWLQVSLLDFCWVLVSENSPVLGNYFYFPSAALIHDYICRGFLHAMFSAKLLLLTLLCYIRSLWVSFLIHFFIHICYYQRDHHTLCFCSMQSKTFCL